VEILKKGPELAIVLGTTEITLMLMVVALEVIKTDTEITQTLTIIVTVNVKAVVEDDTKTTMHSSTM
jgi:hypothetical protein